LPCGRPLRPTRASGATRSLLLRSSARFFAHQRIAASGAKHTAALAARAEQDSLRSTPPGGMTVRASRLDQLLRRGPRLPEHGRAANEGVNRLGVGPPMEVRRGVPGVCANTWGEGRIGPRSGVHETDNGSATRLSRRRIPDAQQHRRGKPTWIHGEISARSMPRTGRPWSLYLSSWLIWATRGTISAPVPVRLTSVRPGVRCGRG